jgi:dimeric dUTPase (all-alpha-NTP-PPase superfamily)
MNLNTLFDKQEKLDNAIIEKLNAEMKENGQALVGPRDLVVHRLLALQVEVGELANALKGQGFKYWSQKPAEERERLLDEYVDILHFWLSCGLSLGFDSQDVEEAYMKKNAVNFERLESGY